MVWEWREEILNKQLKQKGANDDFQVQVDDKIVNYNSNVNNRHNYLMPFKEGNNPIGNFS